MVEKTAYVKRNAFISLGLSIFCLLFCGFIGFYSFGLASSVVETIDYYNVRRDMRAVALAAKVISALGIVFWIVGIVGYFLARRNVGLR
ncbi:MAG: hypothetical protein ABIP75_18585 [Pyrinomonadaceae bacterium]